LGEHALTAQRYGSLRDQLSRVRDEAVVVLGNHDFESGTEAEIDRRMTNEGIKVLDGSA
jgi:hypothetical protein